MAKSKPLPDGEQSFGCGPFTGVWNTREPFDDTPDRLQDLAQMYLPDPQAGCAAYTRPGFVLTDTQYGPLSVLGQGVYSFVSASGAITNFAVFGGTLYTVSSLFVATATAYTSLYYGGQNRVWLTQLGNEVVVSDGSNKPFIYSTGAPIEFQSPTVGLSSGGLSIAYAAFVGSYKGTSNAAVVTSYPAGTKAITAGTIPVDQWGIYRVYVTSGGTISMVAGAANTTTGYATEAAAIAAKPALPSSTDWDIGYFTVKTHAGQPWVAGTDQLAGGGGVHPADATNYYAPVEGLPWAAYGRPTVYQGSLFFIVAQAGGVSSQTSITWSEPNQPTVGYQQTDYDNVWTVAQASSLPLYAIYGTNQGLFYSRQTSWGVLQGTPNVNFASTATSDLISENIGCVACATVASAGNYLYFADQFGRPHRFAFGGAVEPLWLQMRQVYDTAFQSEPASILPSNVALYAWGVIDPQFNTYLCAPWFSRKPSGATAWPNKAYLFDTTTGRHMGWWAIEPNDTANVGVQMQIAGILRDADNDVILTVLGAKEETGNGGYIWALRTTAGTGVYQWYDGTTTASVQRIVRWSMVSPRMGYGMQTQYAWTKFVSTATPANSKTVTCTMSALTASGSSATATLTIAPSATDGITRSESSIGTLSGRGCQVTFGQKVQAYTTNNTEQVQVYRFEVNGVPSLAGVSDP